MPSICYSPHTAPPLLFFFFFNDTATTEIYTLSLHDALPISFIFGRGGEEVEHMREAGVEVQVINGITDRKSTRLNSSHGYISYAVFCLKKKKKIGKLPAMTSSTYRAKSPAYHLS